MQVQDNGYPRSNTANAAIVIEVASVPYCSSYGCSLDNLALPVFTCNHYYLVTIPETTALNTTILTVEANRVGLLVRSRYGNIQIY